MRNLKKVIWWALVIGVMIVIFNFSSEKAVDSADTSKRFIRILIDIFPFTKNLTEIAKLDIITSFDFIVRKCAHFTLYAMLGFVLFGAVKSSFLITLKSNVIYAFIIAVIYAITDEIHQYFVPGRACRIYDVTIDTLGCAFGITVFILLGYIFKKIYRKS